MIELLHEMVMSELYQVRILSWITVALRFANEWHLHVILLLLPKTL